MNRLLESLRRPAAALIGAVFLVSGLLKLLDPTGTALIVSEYFKFLHLDFLNSFSRAFGLALSLLESLTGAALLAGVWRKWVILLAGAMGAFFTVVTLVLLIVNPEMDCGCFGQMIHLTHLQSFLKNAVLMLLWALAAFPLCDIGAPRSSKYVSFSVVAAAIVWFGISSLFSLPLIDKTDLAIGVELSASDDDTPLLSIRDFDGNYCEDILQEGPVMVISVYDAAGASSAGASTTGTSTAGASSAGVSATGTSTARASTAGVSATGTSTAGVRDNTAGSTRFGTGSARFNTSSARFGTGSARFNTSSALRLIALCEQMGIEPVVLCSGDASALTRGIPDNNIYFADRRSLLSLNRSNGGATFLYDGQIVSKWMARSYPGAEQLGSLLESDTIEVIDSNLRHGHIVFQSVLLSMFAVLLFV